MVFPSIFSFCFSRKFTSFIVPRIFPSGSISSIVTFLNLARFPSCRCLTASPSHTELEDLDEPARKKACTEAAAFEEKVLKQDIPDISQTKTVYPTSILMSHTLGILADYFPISHQAEECSNSTGRMVVHTYYHCTICTYKSQNCDSMYMHTRCHLNIVLGCMWPICTKTYDAPDGLSTHVNKVHGGLLLPEALTKDEAESVVTSLSTSQR